MFALSNGMKKLKRNVMLEKISSEQCWSAIVIVSGIFYLILFAILIKNCGKQNINNQ
jgi:hypothetical protein